MARRGMVIDLHKCVGCGACALVCKTENNTRDRGDGQTFNWADFIYREEGRFPNVKYTALPVLCNHCSNAACVKACPVEPKAMFKAEDGTTLHNDDSCIGCKKCMKACPYSAQDVVKEGAAYSVISCNTLDGPAHPVYADKEELIPGCTTSGAELAKLAGDTPPHHTRYESSNYGSVRPDGVTEKCIFCAHRVAKGEMPRCVDECPAGARIFGDLDDPASAPSLALKKHKSFRLKEEAGTKPNVYYIRDFSMAPS